MRTNRSLVIANVMVVTILSLLSVRATAQGGREVSPGRALSIYAPNPAYFQSAEGKPLVFIGDYQASPTSPTAVPIDPNYDYLAYLDTLRANGLNFAKVWINYGIEAEYDSETSFGGYHRFNLMPFLRVGPGLANDGRAKYDLTQLNSLYFDRVAAFCAAARQRGIYLHLVLIDAWIFRVPSLWKFHMYNQANNVNGVDGDPKRTGVSTDPEQGSCSLGNTQVLEAEKNYVRRLVDTVNDFDNIMFEVANENYYNLRWEMAMAEFVHEYEMSKPRRHLVMPMDLPDHDYKGPSYDATAHNDHSKTWKTWDLAQLHARFLAARDLKQPLIYDTDGIESNDNPVQRKGFWTAFASGGHVNYTDYSFQPEVGGDEGGLRRADTRQQLGYLANFTRHVHFWEMHPVDWVRSGDAYALGSPQGAVVYLPSGGSVELDMQGMSGSFRARWYDPRNGLFSESTMVAGGKTQTFQAPSPRDWALDLQREGADK